MYIADNCIFFGQWFVGHTESVALKTLQAQLLRGKGLRYHLKRAISDNDGIVRITVLNAMQQNQHMQMNRLCQFGKIGFTL